MTVTYDKHYRAEGERGETVRTADHEENVAEHHHTDRGIVVDDILREICFFRHPALHGVFSFSVLQDTEIQRHSQDIYRGFTVTSCHETSISVLDTDSG